MKLILNRPTKKKVEISGKYSPSSFGNYLNYLIRHPKPVYENDPLLPDSPKLLSIPKEMWRLVDYLHNHRQPDLFIQLGQPEEIKSIIRSLDSGIEFTNDILFLLFLTLLLLSLCQFNLIFFND